MAVAMKPPAGSAVDPLAFPLQRQEQAYLDYVQGLKFLTLKGMVPALQRTFDEKGTLDGDWMYKFHQKLAYDSQQMMWSGIDRACNRDEAFIERALADAKDLRLDPDIELPRYFQVAFHCRPGGYIGNSTRQGWYTELANYAYFAGTENNRESKYTGVDMIPRADYKRILDMACGIGQSTWPLCDRYPEADVYGIDLSEGSLRYAAKRAEGLGLNIHYSQQNAEHTDFSDGFFDLVYAHILFHELPAKASKNVIAEAFRLLSPGGRFALADVEPYRHATPFRAYVSDCRPRTMGRFTGGRTATWTCRDCSRTPALSTSRKVARPSASAGAAALG